MKQYITVPVALAFSVNKGNQDAAFQQFQDTINSYAQQGWSYHSMQDIVITENPGCFLQHPVSYTKYMFIFYREV